MSRSSDDERSRKLHERLVTWWLGSFMEGTELRGIWDDAFRRFDAHLRDYLDLHPGDDEQALATSQELLLTCFERSLDDHDHILTTFPHELPEGWQEWLPED